MTNTTQQLDELIKASRNILLVCHSSPDPDAMGSLLAMEHIVRENYKKLFITPVAETVSPTLSFIPGFHKVNYHGILKHLLTSSPDLIIFLDMAIWHMTSPKDSQQIKDEIIKRKIPTIVIDHHPLDDKAIDATLYINHNDSSTCQTLYRIFRDELKFELSTETYDCLLAGIISDTDRFRYTHDSNSYTFSILPDIVDKATTDVETISKTLTTFQYSILKPLEIFLKNTIMKDSGLIFSTIGDIDVTRSGLVKSDIGSAAKFFLSNILLNVEGAEFGFALYPFAVGDLYTISFRSTSDEYDVQKIAEKLGGGGHTKAAAARVKAKTSDEALQAVLDAIKG